jgi:hypothetical protein
MRIPIHRLLLAPLGREQCVGTCEYATRTITLDPRKPWIAQTFLHELIHLSHPSWSERRVEAETRQRWGRLSWRDKAKLLQALGKAKLGVDLS